eukprot:7115638-Pyramimonas_sp.AAC.1
MLLNSSCVVGTSEGGARQREVTDGPTRLPPAGAIFTALPPPRAGLWQWFSATITYDCSGWFRRFLHVARRAGSPPFPARAAPHGVHSRPSPSLRPIASTPAA